LLKTKKLTLFNTTVKLGLGRVYMTVCLNTSGNTGGNTGGNRDIKKAPTEVEAFTLNIN